jgi:DNA-binding MarR family transcriptional regulator
MPPRGGRNGRETGTIGPQQVARIADFRAALRRFERHVERAARRQGLTPQRFLLLLQIEGAAGDLRVGELAERMQLTPNTVTELIIRAEEARLVRRASSAADARVVNLETTAEGRRRLYATLAEADGYRKELREAFDHLAEQFERSTESPRKQR